MSTSVRFWPIAAYHNMHPNVRFQYKADIQLETLNWHCPTYNIIKHYLNDKFILLLIIALLASGERAE